MSWRALRVRGPKEWSWNNVVREATRGRSGAYAIRERASRRVVYVGESHAGAERSPLRFWKTITRHFQDPTGKFAEQREVTFTSRHPDKYEVQVWVTSPGDAAMRRQAELIQRLKPTQNVDDGRAYDDSFDFGANVRANPAPSPLADVDAKSGMARRLALQVFGGGGRLDVRMMPGPHGDEPVVREGARIVFTGADLDASRWIVRALQVYRTLRHERGPELNDLELARALPRRRGRWPAPPYSTVGSGGSALIGTVPVRVVGADGMAADAKTMGEADALVALLRLADLGDAWRALGKRLDRETAAQAHDAAEGGHRAAFAELAGLLPPREPRTPRSRATKGRPAEQAARPEGYGEPSEHRGAAPGQLKLTNGSYPAGSRAELVHRVYEEARAMGLEPNRDIAPAYDANVGRWVVTDRLGQQHHVRVHFSAERAKRHGMVLANPGAPPATKRARELAAREYREKHWGEEPKGVARELDVVDVGHGVLVELGVLERVEYCTSKGGDPKGATYYHDFGGRLPVLAYHSCERAGCPDVGKLVIAGGSYKVRKHGIVG